MKKLFLFIGLVMASIFSIQSQEIADNAIGLRFAENNGIGAEFTYQRKLSEATRLEVDLGIRDSYFKATGLYQWVNHLDGDFNWYVGAGGGLGAGENINTFIVGSGVIGVEYNFDIPLMIALDFRPELGLINADGLSTDFGLAVRYKF